MRLADCALIPIALSLVFGLSAIAQLRPVDKPDDPAKEEAPSNPPPPPSPTEQKRVIEKTRELALVYTAGLPNFLCTETVRRYATAPRTQAWLMRDTLRIDVGYSKKGEVYKLVAINDQPTKKKLGSMGGFQSSGEFGTRLKRIFIPEAKAFFEWERWTNLQGRLMYVFSYQIAQANSTYKMDFTSPKKHYRMVAGVRGVVYIDRETNQVMRFSDEAVGIPDNWPIKATPAILDYDYADVVGQRFLLPKRVDSRVVMKDGEGRNVIEFGNYRKFSSEITVTFEKEP